MLALTVLPVFAAQWGYFAIFEILWKGQTPGKRQAGIRVINETGREASVYEAVARNLLRAVDALPGPYAVGAIVMFLSPQSKRIGDYVAGTVVIHDRKLEDEAIFFNTSSEDPTAAAINCETLSHRRSAGDGNLPPAAGSISPSTCASVPPTNWPDTSAKSAAVPEGTHPDNENLLETLVRGFRRSGRSHLR